MDGCTAASPRTYRIIVGIDQNDSVTVIASL